jgi:hypothetical protein
MHDEINIKQFIESCLLAVLVIVGKIHKTTERSNNTCYSSNSKMKTIGKTNQPTNLKKKRTKIKTNPSWNTGK